MFRPLNGARFIAVICLMLAAACPSMAASEYQGSDAGFLIFSMGSIKIPINSTFYYRRIGAGSRGRGVMDYAAVGFFPDTADYQGHETGKVTVRRLEPGDYEVYQLSFSGTIIVANIEWSAKKEFSIPFTIKPGVTTYIGNFARAPSLGTPLEPLLGAKGFFVISDKHDRDIEIARKREPNLPSVTVSVTDPSSWGYPILLSKEP